LHGKRVVQQETEFPLRGKFSDGAQTARWWIERDVEIEMRDTGRGRDGECRGKRAPEQGEQP
jgi:hypothetical protein